MTDCNILQNERLVIMEYKTTRKAIVNDCSNIRYARYCALSHILRYHEPVAYTKGVYGWNFDVYEVYGLTICTGYRNMPGEKLMYVDEYEKKARDIFSFDNDMHFEEKKEAVEKLLQEFCVLNGGYV